MTAEVAAKSVEPGNDGPVTLTFADVAWAGNFITQVSLASPSFATGKSVPLKVIVRDGWFWPLVAIALGVFGGFAAQFAAQTLRPRRENTYQITRLRAEIVRHRGLVRKTSKIATLAALTDRLRAADEQNTFGQASNAKALIDQVVQDLAAFLKAEETAREKVETDIKTLKAQINKYRDQRGVNATPEEARFFTASEGGFGGHSRRVPRGTTRSGSRPLGRPRRDVCRHQAAAVSEKPGDPGRTHRGARGPG